jgi:hypothetical protein
MQLVLRIAFAPRNIIEKYQMVGFLSRGQCLPDGFWGQPGVQQCGLLNLIDIRAKRYRHITARVRDTQFPN